MSSDWRFVGYRNVPESEGGCTHRVQMVHVRTGERREGRCRSTRRSRCGYCSKLHRGDVAAIGRSGWIDRPTDRGYWVTFTAPGADVLPWDRSKCVHGDELECAGALGCVVDAVTAAAWHADIGQRWSWLVTELRRQLGPGVRVEFVKTWELQQRGVLHAHVLMRVEGVVSDRRVRAALKLARMRWGFGKQTKVETVDLSNSEAVARVSGYLAKYVSKNADVLPGVQRLDRETGEMQYGAVRPWSASRSWGDTMRSIRERRAVFAQERAAASGAVSVGGAPAQPIGAAAGGALDLNQDRYADGISGLVDYWVDRLL